MTPNHPYQQPVEVLFDAPHTSAAPRDGFDRQAIATIIATRWTSLNTWSAFYECADEILSLAEPSRREAPTPTPVVLVTDEIVDDALALWTGDK